jgi:hypothetical protein
VPYIKSAAVAAKTGTDVHSNPPRCEGNDSTTV